MAAPQHAQIKISLSSLVPLLGEAGQAHLQQQQTFTWTFSLFNPSPMFGKEEELICWWGNKSTMQHFQRELWSWDSLFPHLALCGFSKIKLNDKNARHFAQQLLSVVS